MAIVYPAYPRIPEPTNVLEKGLSGLMEGWEAGRKKLKDKQGVDAAYDVYSNAPGRQAPNLGFLSGLGGQAAAGMGGSAPAPGTTTGGATPSKALTGDSGRIYGDFIGTVKAGDPALGLAGVTNPYGLAAVASTGRAESGYSPGNIHRQWSDPSESGKAGNAGGIMSWRAERLANMRAFASKVGDDPNRPSAATQAKFFLAEDPSLVAKLNAAQSPEEAQQLMNRAWAFAGYDRPGGEAARRTAMARSYYANEFGRGGASAAIEAQAPQRPVEVASIEPGAGMDTALAYSPAGPSAAAGAGPSRIPLPTARPEDLTYTTASPTAPGNGDAAPAASAPRMLDVPSLVSAVAGGQVSGPNLTREQFTALLGSDQTRQLAIELFRSKVTGDPNSAMKAMELGLQLENLNYNRQRQFSQDALAAEDRAYERGRDTVADQRWQQEQDLRVQSATAKAEGFRQATPEEAARYGASAGQFGPDGRFYPINPPQGMTVESDGQGGFRMVQGSGVQNRPLTEGQSKDAVFSTRAEGALQILDPKAGALTSRSDRALDYVPGGFGRDYQSTDFQLAQQAGDEFLQAILRKDTGAAITEQEQALYGTTYLPRPGDSEELLQQKALSRTRAVQAIKAGMPPAAILQQELALRNTAEAGRSQIVPGSDVGADAVAEPGMPEGMDPAIWGVMTPEEKRLWQN